MSDTTQDVINQLSIVMTSPEDIFKLCKQHGIHPDISKMLIHLHSQQLDIEKTIKEHQKLMYEMASTIAVQSNLAETMHERFSELARTVGFGKTNVEAAELT